MYVAGRDVTERSYFFFSFCNLDWTELELSGTKSGVSVVLAAVGYNIAATG